MTARALRTTCGFCGVGCGVVAEVEGERVTGVRGDLDHPANRGALCPKGLALAETLRIDGRLLHPRARPHKNAVCERASWSAVLDRIARAIEHALAARGPDAIGFYLSGQLLTEDYYAFHKLARGFLGTSHIDSNSRLCMSSAVAGYQRAFGQDGPPTCYDDIDHADLILLVGSNTAWCHPIVFRRIEEARAKRRPRPVLVVLDPRRTATAAVADIHVALQPGSDVVFLTAMLAVLWRRGRLDRAWMRAHTENFEALECMLPDFDAHRVERECGVPETLFERTVEAFAGARAALTLFAMGVNQSAHGTDTVNAITNLHLATGHIGRPGTGPFSLTGQPNAMGGRETGAMATLLPGHRRIESARDRAEVEALWKCPPLPAAPGRTAVELFEHAADGGLDLLWIVASNPLATLPHRSRVQCALERTPLVIVQDLYADTDTARYADVLLPAAGWGEKNGTMTNSERGVSRVRRLVSAPGEARPDWEIAAQVAARLGFGACFAWKDDREIWAEHVATTAGRDLDQSGITAERLDAGPIQWPCPDRSHPGTPRLYADGNFPTRSGKARFVVPRRFSAWEAPTAARPLVLLTTRDRDQWHTMTRTGRVARLRAHEPAPLLEIAAVDAAARGIASGDRVRVRSERGAFEAFAEVSEAVPPGVVTASMHWSEATAPGSAANAATHGALDPVSKQPELKHAAVSIERVGPGSAPVSRGLCACHGVSAAAVAEAIAAGAQSVSEVSERTRAGRGCGSCRAEIAAHWAHREEASVERIVVIGNGMVGHRFVTALAERNAARRLHITVIGEEPRVAYDRVHLSELFSGKSAADLALSSADEYAARGIELRLGARAIAIDRTAREVALAGGERIGYDRLVLATGSEPFVPPIPGAGGPNVFVYRRIEDVEAIGAHAVGARVGIVIGGGLLGLEAAKALLDLGLETHVVEASSRLMPRQLDEAGAALLRSRIEALGVQVHLGRETVAIDAAGEEETDEPAGDDPAFADAGASLGVELRFADGARLVADLVVVSAGIRPRDELAAACGLERGARGGVVVDDTLTTSDPRIHAIGEVAAHRGAIYGLVAPGHAMADTLAWNLTRAAGEAPRRFEGADLSTRLKLLGVEVASIGNPFDVSSRSLVFEDQVREVYARLVLARGSERLVGAVLVGDTRRYAELLDALRRGMPVVDAPAALFGARAEPASGVESDDVQVCSCNDVRRAALRRAIREGALETLAAVKKATRAGTGCGGCLPLVSKILAAELAAAGRAASNHLCEHFPHTRQELFQIVQVTGARRFDEVLARHGRGAGCEICKPALASIFASLWNEPIREQATIQDTNDRFLANIQRGGTYSVVPRIPGGEITPEKLIVLGEVARRYGLYCKITGGQRIDLLGARVEQLPEIWSDLVEAGFESGHAYGKAMRTVKSCVGSTWCRFGVQDSTALAIRLEQRYRGIRAPHKIKAAVSGCIRECAEAQSKDFGVIATERGWNLYVCGNGGSKPRHAELLAADLDEETLIRFVDRFLMFYIRTADHLTRTARWLESLPGGLEYLRKVVVEDHLGIAAELERQVQQLVDGYECEWARVVRDPVERARFRAFANTTEPDPTLRFIEERGQRRPAEWPRAPRPPLAAGAERVWVPLAAVEEVPNDGGIAVRYGETQIALFHVAARGRWFACQNECPHTGDAVLARGLVGDAAGRPKVACPQHKKTFDLETGAGLSDPELAITTFAVREEGGKLFVELPPAASLGRTPCQAACVGGMGPAAREAT